MKRSRSQERGATNNAQVGSSSHLWSTSALSFYTAGLWYKIFILKSPPDNRYNYWKTANEMVQVERMESIIGVERRNISNSAVSAHVVGSN